MIKRTRAEISKCIIHKVANKYNSGQNAFSEELVRFDEESYELLLPFLLKPFGTETQSYRFTHHADTRLNNLNKYASNVFDIDTDSIFIENSRNIVNHLYEQSNSAQIKTGDVLVVYFEGIEYKDILTEAVGVFKIESKSDFFQTYLDGNYYDVVVQKGISPKKLDKGCLILNTSDAEGTVVLSVDNNQYDAQYWLKNFLNVRYADDKNLHTQNYLEMCREFSEEVLKPEQGKLKQNAFLADTIDFFKENETVSFDDFKSGVLPEETHSQFEEYKSYFEKLNDLLLRNTIEVSEMVLKKEKSKFKTEIKLDTNIQIKIDIDAPDAATEYLEQGYDEEKKMKFYKVFYNAEK
nr:nucleoid-associated protein [Tenacibaculum mesophilum]